MATFDDTLKALDEAFAKQRETAKIPGLAWGVVRDGALVHTGGAGTIRDGESTVPDQRTVFRIASMTKSFTAATILRLRDEGRLRLDDEVAAYVPALADWRHPASDAPAITIRHLLTMSAGLPTDDPWGDRQQAPPPRRLRRAAARRTDLRLAAGDAVRLLQPGLRDPRSRRDGRRGRGVPRRRAGPVPGPARA